MIAALYVRSDSVYFDIPEVDCFDIVRDARTFKKDSPVVAHPPCRAWGRLRHLAKPRPGEKDLALHAIECIRECGGVLEHPQGSKLFGDILPEPGERDAHGFTVCVDQCWFGHKARKRTNLYICGIEPQQLPTYPLDLGYPEYVVMRNRKGSGNQKEITKEEREATPRVFATWLVEIAGQCHQLHQKEQYRYATECLQSTSTGT